MVFGWNIGINSSLPDWNLSSDIYSASTKYGIDIDGTFDSTYVTSLPGNKVGYTAPSTGTWLFGGNTGNYLTLDGHDMPRLDPEQREHVLLHEWVHAKNDQGELYGELLGRGMQRETADALWQMVNSSNERVKEGGTEFISLYLDPDSSQVAGTSYPVETAAVSRYLDGKGLHPDPGLESDIEGYLSMQRGYSRRDRGFT